MKVSIVVDCPQPGLFPGGDLMMPSDIYPYDVAQMNLVIAPVRLIALLSSGQHKPSNLSLYFIVRKTPICKSAYNGCRQSECLSRPRTYVVRLPRSQAGY